jgi:hypothetical protein
MAYCKPFPDDYRVISGARISGRVKIDLMARKAAENHGGYISG